MTNQSTALSQSFESTIKGSNSFLEVANEFEESSREIEQQLPLNSKFFTGSDLIISGAEKMPCLIDPVFPKVGNVCLAGGSDTGKSSLLRQIAIKIATGDPKFLEWDIKATHNKAVFVASEDDKNATSYLLSRQTMGFDYEKKQRLSNVYFMFEIENIYEELDTFLTSTPVDAVFMDCFSDVFGGDLKDTQKIRTCLHSFQELAAKHQCLFVWLHHTAKRTESTEPSKNNLLSGQGFEAKMRMVMELRQDQEEPNKRHLCIVKGNYLPAKMKRESFVLNFSETTFTFSETDERVPFEMLVKQNLDDGGKAKYLEAKALKEKGKTFEEIAGALGYDSKGTISKLFKRAEKNGWDK